MNLLQTNIIDQIADERDELRGENRRMIHRIELLEAANSDVARIAQERDDALMTLGVYWVKSDEQKDRIKQLEGIIERATTAFFVDGSHKSTSVAMLMILAESEKPNGTSSNQPNP